MFVLGNILMGLGRALDAVLWIYMWVLFASAVVSWVSADPRNPIVHYIRMATDPVLRVIRRLLPMNLRYFPIDIAFLVLFAIVVFSKYAIAQTLFDIGARMRGPTAPVSAI